MTETKVRVGTPEDIHPMMDLAMSAADENGFIVPSQMRLLEALWPALNMKEGIVGIVGEPGQEIEAAILLRIGLVWYSDQEVIEERAIYVSPKFRDAKGKRAEALANFAKETSDRTGIPLAIGVLSNHRTKGKIRFYERIFGEPAGVYFLYNAQTGVTNKAEATDGRR